MRLKSYKRSAFEPLRPDRKAEIVIVRSRRSDGDQRHGGCVGPEKKNAPRLCDAERLLS